MCDTSRQKKKYQIFNRFWCQFKFIMNKTFKIPYNHEQGSVSHNTTEFQLNYLLHSFKTANRVHNGGTHFS